MLATIIRPRGNVAGFDPDSRDARVVEHDAEEGQVSIPRGGRDEATECQPAVLVEVFDQRAGMTVSVLPARSAAIWLVNIGEDGAEAPDRCWNSSIGAGYEEQSLSDVAPHWGEQPRGAEGPE